MAGYIDAWGRGTLKIIQACSEAGLPEPPIAEKDGGFMVTLTKTAQDAILGSSIGGPINGQVIQMNSLRETFGSLSDLLNRDAATNKEKLERLGAVMGSILRSNFGLISEEIRTTFGQTGMFVVALLLIDNTATAKTMSKILRITKRTIENYLHKLKEQNVIDRKGSDKTGYYEFKIQK